MTNQDGLKLIFREKNKLLNTMYSINSDPVEITSYNML